MMLRSILTIAALFGAGAAPASAEPAPDDAIVIEGERLTVDEMKRGARGMIRELAPLPWTDQYARWNNAICPKVIGIADKKAAAIVTDKIRLVAAEAGVKAGRPGCKPNILVAFTDDAGQLFRKVAGRRAQMFDYVMPQEAAALRKSDLPVRWWYALQTAGSQGHMAASGNEAPGGNRMPVNDFGGASIALYNGGSLINSPVQSSVLSAAILVDVNRAEGTRLDALAAYVAMIALAPSRMPPRELAVPSITNLFTADRDKSDLTEWDRAYLEALYTGANQRTSFVQRAAMVGRMAERIAGR